MTRISENTFHVDSTVALQGNPSIEISFNLHYALGTIKVDFPDLIKRCDFQEVSCASLGDCFVNESDCPQGYVGSQEYVDGPVDCYACEVLDEQEQVVSNEIVQSGKACADPNGTHDVFLNLLD